MTKEGILDYFKDINGAYNNCNMHDDLSRMLDELLKEQTQIVMCKDCVNKGNHVVCILDRDLQEYGGHRTAEYDDWFCANGKRAE